MRGLVGHEQTSDGRRDLGALALPVLDALTLDEEVTLFTRIESTNRLQKTTAARTALVGDDDAVNWSFFLPSAGETNMNSH